MILTSARKEPHYRIYCWPSLDRALGRLRIRPDCDALQAQLPPSHLQVYKFPEIRQAPCKIFFGHPTVQILSPVKKAARSKVRVSASPACRLEFG
jgi:hypothetical protein